MVNPVGEGSNDSRLPQVTDDEGLLCRPNFAAAREDATWVSKIATETGSAFDRLAGIGRAVSFFGSARTQPGDPDYELAREAAAELSRNGFAVITGGGPGIMEAANRGAFEAGGTSVGLAIELADPQPTNRYVGVEVNFHHFFVRKLMFVRYACAFVIFPGGYGTLDELFEALTLMQTGKIQHFPVIVAGAKGWGLEAMLEGLGDRGRLFRHELDLIHWTDDPVQIREMVCEAAKEQVLDRNRLRHANPDPAHPYDEGDC